MKKIIRNIGYVHPLKTEDTREYVTRVDYAARSYQFPAGQEVAVEADVADYISSQYAGKGLVIVDRKAEVDHHLKGKLAAARALLPPAPSGPAIPAHARRGLTDRPKPLAGTHAIALARAAATKGATALSKRPAPAAPAAATPKKVSSPAIEQAAEMKSKLAAARAKVPKAAPAPAPVPSQAAPSRPAATKDKVADTKARIAASKAKR